MKYKVLSYGFGPIGQAIAKVALSRPDQIDLIGAVDVDPELKGKDVGDLLDMRRNGIRVTSAASELYKEADVVLHATSSFLSAAKAQLIDVCSHGVDIVSTCEELSFPWYSHEIVANEIDLVARKNGVTLLATGVNPGFVLDALVVSLSGVCSKVSEIRGERVLDASKRRLPFQKKVGIGLEVGQFEENVRTGKFGHVGLPESMALVCATLGKKMERVEQRITPKVADRETPTEHFGVIKAGNVLGLVQDAAAYAASRRVISYHLEMYSGAEDPHDEVEIIGEPNMKLRIPGGTPGDTATAAIVVNSIPRVVESGPGLLTVKDLRPAASVFSF